jgi:hypothetical protein
VDCGPDHFSAMTASPPGGPTTSEGVAASLLRSPACTLAIDLMGSHAIRGRPPPPPPPPPPPGGGGRTEAAALAVWGYGEGCATIDAAVMRTLGAFRRNNFGIVDLLHSPVAEPRLRPELRPAVRARGGRERRWRRQRGGGALPPADTRDRRVQGRNGGG